MNNTNSYTALDIANYFINKLRLADNIRLNKLVYITYGFYYAYFDKKLFNEPIEAWRFGPVIPTIYHSFKNYGWSLICKPVGNYNPNVDNDEKLQAILEGVTSIYGNMSARDLIDRTHKKGTPWEQVYKPGMLYTEIDDDRIQKYYKSLLILDK